MLKFDNCPLCKGEASITEKGRGTFAQKNSFYIRFVIQCRDCGLSTREYIHEFTYKKGKFSILFDGFTEATNDWNERAHKQENPPLPEHFAPLPCEIGDTVYVPANGTAEKVRVKAFKVYEDQLFVGTTIGEFDAIHVYNSESELWENEYQEVKPF